MEYLKAQKHGSDSRTITRGNSIDKAFHGQEGHIIILSQVGVYACMTHAIFHPPRAHTAAMPSSTETVSRVLGGHYQYIGTTT